MDNFSKEAKPWMHAEDIQILKDAFLSLNKSSINVLEWGAGGSTVYFTEFLKVQGIRYHWLSLEYNKEWFEKVKNVVCDDKAIEVVLFEFTPGQPSSNIVEYIKYPSKINEKYDFILVDGRERARCLIESRHLLNPEGIVFLHDAERIHYHYAMKEYPVSGFVSSDRKGAILWRGKL